MVLLPVSLYCDPGLTEPEQGTLGNTNLEAWPSLEVRQAGVGVITCAQHHFPPSFFFNSSNHKCNSFQMLLISFCLPQLKQFTRGKGLNSGSFFLFCLFFMPCYCLWIHTVFVQSFRLSPAGFGFLPSLYLSLPLVSSLCSTHCPPCCQAQISLHSPLFHVDGGGTDSGDDGEIDHRGITHTHA